MITAFFFHLRVYLFCSFCGCGVGRASERAGAVGISPLYVFFLFSYIFVCGDRG